MCQYFLFKSGLFLNLGALWSLNFGKVFEHLIINVHGAYGIIKYSFYKVNILSYKILHCSDKLAKRIYPASGKMQDLNTGPW